MSYIPNRFRLSFLLIFLFFCASLLVLYLDLLPSLSASDPSHPLAMIAGHDDGGGGGESVGGGGRNSYTKRTEGLKAHGKDFTLNKRPFYLASGALHYFRVVPEYWLDRLTKLKAAGLAQRVEFEFLETVLARSNLSRGSPDRE